MIDVPVETGLIRPVLLLIVATPVALLVHDPPVVVFVKDAVCPMQYSVVPALVVIGDVTVTVTTLEQFEAFV